MPCVKFAVQKHQLSANIVPIKGVAIVTACITYKSITVTVTAL